MNQDAAENPECQLLILTAASDGALVAKALRLKEWMEAHPTVKLADIAFCLQNTTPREPFYRLLIVKNREQALAFLPTDAGLFAKHDAIKRDAIFLFSGQGSEYLNMTRGLYQTEAAYREPFDQIADILRSRHNFDLPALIFPEPGQESAAEALLAKTRYTQPALFAVSYALAKWWLSLGIQPRAMFGHSIGEFVAATLAGVFELNDAIALVVGRGLDLQAQPSGALLSVYLNEEEARQISGVSISAVNGPHSCVVGGEPEAIEVAEQILTYRGIAFGKLQGTQAFHTCLIAGMAKHFRPRFAKMTLHPPKIPFISNLSGTWITDAQATDPDYWVKQCLNSVRFYTGIQTLLEKEASAFIEVGPGNRLLQLAKLIVPQEQLLVATVRQSRDSCSDREALLEAVGLLSVADFPIKWTALHQSERDYMALPLEALEPVSTSTQPIAAKIAKDT